MVKSSSSKGVENRQGESAGYAGDENDSEAPLEA
jgi:hypothetical protein